jgi:hypothetical protein
MTISGVIVDKLRVVVDSMPYRETIMPPSERESSECWAEAISRTEALLNWQYMCYLLARAGTELSRKERLATFCRTMAFGVLPKLSAAPDAEYIEGFQALREKLTRITERHDRHNIAFRDTESSNRHCLLFESRFAELSAGRKFCVTKEKRLAWVPRNAKPDDGICFLTGCAVPFVIRRAGELWELLGDCYLSGEMSDQSRIFGLPVKPQVLTFQ